MTTCTPANQSSSMTSTLHLIAPNEQPPDDKPTAVQNLLEHFNLMNTFEAFSQSSSKTFKSYIRHLPGDFHISKQGRVDPAGSLKKVLENAPPPGDAQPIVFRPISERQLQAAFTLQDGGYKKKKKKKSKRDKENGGSGGSEEKKKKKKRHRDANEPEAEPKKKKKKKDKEKEMKTIPAKKF
eukprot:Phypoly_transcript_15868.p1 GENE.Phypoly_transcript_15868~~Phypoly_transcript_15868.p1  ORF type:complete len:182 (+),score=45.96 Phypoly_transcript_15868:103-648(+)